VATLDFVILSGHRRRVACKLAGLKMVPVRFRADPQHDPEFPKLLIEYNPQRVKSLDDSCARKWYGRSGGSPSRADRHRRKARASI